MSGPGTAEELRPLLERDGQAHLLDGVDELDAATRGRFLARVAEVDWRELARTPPPLPLDDVGPPEVVSFGEQARRRDELRRAGEEAYRAGRVAVLMVAGGQGTRLGFAGPKGAFPLAPLSGKTIYQLQAEKVLSLSRRVGPSVSLLVMTSPATDEATRAFFAEHDRFGLADEQVRFLRQGTVPSTDLDGRALMASPGTLLENPDGHGGALGALAGAGELDRLAAEGVAYLVYVQVDNVLARVDDPVLVGLAAAEHADVVSKVLEKAHPDEKLGHLVSLHGRQHVVEYTELSAEQVRARASDGTPLLRWGSPALHCWSVAFLASLAARGFRPPLHRSRKPLRAWTPEGERDVDGWKSERFVFDLLPEAERSVALEVDRDAEFAPVKNAEGEDSPATAVTLAERQYVEWLEAGGARVDLPEGAHVEIGPLYAATREQFLERWDGEPAEVTGDLYLDGSGTSSRSRE